MRPFRAIIGGCVLATVSAFSGEDLARADGCAFGGRHYAEGAMVFGDPCPGQACAATTGPRLTCSHGSWTTAAGGSVCAGYRSVTASPTWQRLPDAVRDAQRRYYRSLGCR